MPKVTIYSSHPTVCEKNEEVCALAHEAVKAKLGKPDMYIAVAMVEARCVMVGGRKSAVHIEVESIGGSFKDLYSELANKIVELCGVDANDIVGTFRNIGMSEFGMGTRTLG
mmetsp:Transcript_750/g.1194  ORF Transcript_750/g.1194 Transcript_750/m.1194 type:complete len:112 (-) Transcript_750:85-420(-)|eukprot:CAMPEP_0169102376 /NCGR_PEP_ID=MMETSP1015-20121227/22135_1 /TAXON_ID=342587 /ORGANISM="Karlodinium micrum, Strain CCMP2283" /LENGTH=111 /DNA_ID=CAMNT_0009163475 /DNA_START=54 /DNA_END=389 /DNA_ORIENTATION=+